jgi:hypothetical protein
VRWQEVDSDLGLAILWSVDDSGAYRAHWEVPLGAAAGTYRFVVRANRYGLTSSTFAVRPSSALTAAQVGAAAGRVAIELRYPEAVSRQSVGDPPGDLTADLTYRPAKALSGRATFLVRGKPVTVSAGANGVFEVPAPSGAAVEVKPGAAADGAGNANGNGLAFTAP